MSTRLLCRVVRTCSALRESSDSRHVAGCADCQNFFQQSAALDANLRRAASATAPTPSAGFERRILQAVHTSRVELDSPASSPARSWRLALSVGGFAAALAVASVVFQRATTTPGNPASLITANDAAALANSVTAFSSRLVDDVIPSAGTLIADNPLQTEMTAISADAKSALDFLALNFLPRRTAAASSPTPRRNG